MPPYVIKQGDFLLKLAHQLGFDPDAVWSDPSNASLRALRPNPAILFPGDVLNIPDSPAPAATTLAPGSTSTFVSAPPPLTLSAKFVGTDATSYASRAYTVTELDALTGLSTDANGVASFQAPVTLTTATVVFTDTGESWSLVVGATDPINTLSGIFKRLQNLGFIGDNVTFDTQAAANNLEVMRDALTRLKAAQPGASTPSSPPSAPAAAPSSPPAASSSPAAPASGAPSAPGSDTPSADGTPASGPVTPSTPAPSGPAVEPAAPSDPSPTSAPSSAAPSSSPPASAPASTPPGSTPPDFVIYGGEDASFATGSRITFLQQFLTMQDSSF